MTSFLPKPEPSETIKKSEIFPILASKISELKETSNQDLQNVKPRPGVNFINVLQAAFAPADPKSVKRH